ncbi:hypothetical protein DL96DRAFT_1710394 [Flagelloscypha sp. PMI_526]|nr:hypothetical protein DL96DRAFT_1710394 [Flagelloscypha sp. PMI_526]
MPSKPATPADALRPDIVKRMVQDGEWDRIMVHLKLQLNEHSWPDEMRGKAQESKNSQNPGKFQAFYDGVRKEAPGSIPAAVRKDIMNLIRKYVEEQLVQA